ncbi:MAG TPA: CapA family protein [Micromonosporaceae bacterium]
MTGTRRRRRCGLAVLGAALVLAACAPTTDAPPAWRDAAADPAAPSNPPSPSEPPELRLVFAGDVHFTGRTLPLLRDPQTAFGDIAATLADGDLTILNLETAVTERGTPQPKRYHFRAPATAYDALRAAGVDAVSLANNHTLDYGQVGLLDTLDSARAADFPVFGAGRDADEAYAPWLATVHGVRIAVLGMSQVHDLAERWKATPTRPGIAMAFDTERAAAAVRAARGQADLVVVFMHWGIEGNPCPSGEMKAFAALLADAGADIVVGTHAHLLLGDGWLGRMYVHYGLGNFLWYGSSRSTDSGVLRLTVRGREAVHVDFLPATVSGTGQPVLVGGRVKEAIQDRLERARRCAGLSPSPA